MLTKEIHLARQLLRTKGNLVVGKVRQRLGLDLVDGILLHLALDDRLPVVDAGGLLIEIHGGDPDEIGAEARRLECDLGRRYKPWHRCRWHFGSNGDCKAPELKVWTHRAGTQTNKKKMETGRSF